MTEPLYNSNSVCSIVCEKYCDPRTEKIVGLVDEFASVQGAEMTAGLFACGTSGVEYLEYKEEAARYVRRNYGSGILGFFAWLISTIIALVTLVCPKGWNQPSEA